MSVYSPYFDVADANIRNTAMLLETAAEALDAGEIDSAEFSALAQDLLDLVDESSIMESIESQTQLEELKQATLTIERG